jgi:hypothetical protein
MGRVQITSRPRRRSLAAGIRRGLLGASLLAGAAGVLPAAASAAGAGSAWHFGSAPALQPPKLVVEHRGRVGNGHALLFLDPYKNFAVASPQVGQSGALIDTAGGDPVWFQRAPAGQSDVDFHADVLGGRRVLVFWQGVVVTTPGGPVPIGEAGAGAHWVILDQHYRRIATVRGGDGWTPDLHELIGGSGDVVIYSVGRRVKANLSALGGPADGTYEDNGVQAADLATGRVLYTWDMGAHVPLAQSATRPAPSGTWDPYHLNSLARAPGGSLVISARNTWSVYDITPTGAGTVHWTLDGKPHATDSSFRFGPGAPFAWQHDARLLPNGELTMFDDHCCSFAPDAPKPPPTARGLILRLDTAAGTANLVASYSRRPPLVVATQGSLELLGSDVLVGWGQEPYVSEFTSIGRLLYDAHLPAADSSYRTLAESWTGHPLSRPAIAARRRGASTFLEASWNGATLVARWQVLHGPSGRHLAKLTTIRRHGFETVIRLRDVKRGYVQLRALSATGRVLGRSKIIHV